MDFQIIQGGMGVGVSDWRLARAVSELGQLGVVSGTLLDVVFARRLQQGDRDGVVREALAEFPHQEMVQRALEQYFVPGGIASDQPFKSIPVARVPLTPLHSEMIVLANFVEVMLAKRGHSGQVGINYLHKVALPMMPALYGAMLAGVDVVIMGAGIPKNIPPVLDSLARHEAVSLDIPVTSTGGASSIQATFNPREFLPSPAEPLRRPKFLAVISSVTLGRLLTGKAEQSADGIIVEDHIAGGHNAPPRGKGVDATDGSPIYTIKDRPNIAEIQALGKPFWLAGACASPERMRWARDQGAVGIQVGTAFAFCRESGLLPEIKEQVLKQVVSGTACVRTDGRASPTGFPFKVVELAQTLSDRAVYERRKRVCDVGSLSEIVRDDAYSLSYRCAAADPHLFAESSRGQTEAKICLCNALLAAIGLGQYRREWGSREIAIVTAGSSLPEIQMFLGSPTEGYSARHVVEMLLA